MLEEFPEAYLSVSHEVLPLYREFERFSTVAPERLRRARRSSRYVARFDEAMREAGFAHGVQLMQSSGGMATVESAAQRPVNLLMSGPVAGLIGGIWAGRMAGLRERRHARHRRHLGRHRRRRRRRSCACATCSTRRSATTRRWCRWSTSTRSAPAAARSPTSTRAACSASARSRRAPTPARPATAAAAREPTSTDAQLAARAACAPTAACSAATMQLDRDLAEQAMQHGRRAARDVGRGGRARRAADPEVRHDPGDRAELGAPRLRPARVHARRRRRRRPAVRLRHRARARDRRACSSRRTPGIIAATGLLATDLQHEFVATERHALKSLDTARLAARASTSSRRRPSRSSTPTACRRTARLVRRLADCRYAGQGYEVRFEVPAGAVDDAWVEELKERFHARARGSSTATASTRAIEIINIRVVGIGRVDELQPDASSRPATAIRRRAKTLEREVVFEVDGPGRAPSHAVLRARAAARGRPARRARRSSSSTTRRR